VARLALDMLCAVIDSSLCREIVDRFVELAEVAMLRHVLESVKIVRIAVPYSDRDKLGLPMIRVYVDGEPFLEISIDKNVSHAMEVDLESYVLSAEAIALYGQLSPCLAHSSAS